jgi:hypothetical protein
MTRIEKGPQHIDIAALLCLVPKAGIARSSTISATYGSADALYMK